MTDTELLALQHKSTAMFSAKVLADSVNSCGDRLTTFELVYPRCIHCYREDTEFLSQIADEFPEFRTYDAIVALEAKIAQYEVTGEISFVEPSGSISKEASVLLECDSKLFPVSVTPEHRMYSLKRSTGNVYFPLIDLASDWVGDGPIGSRRIPKAGSLASTCRVAEVSPQEAALIAFYVADGTLQRDKVVFHFVKQRKVDSVRALLDAVGIPYTYTSYGRDSCIRFDAPWWVSHCYTDDRTKRYPDFLWSMSSEAYAAFYEATLDSDGCRENGEINTFSKECAHQLQVMALLNGKAMNIRQYSGGLYKQTYMDSNYISFRKDKAEIHEVQGKFRVVCFQVPSSLLVVRRNGVAFISGNCEIMTHRLFSRNAASSRAIPLEKSIQAVYDTPFIPFHWGKNQSGMQAYAELDDARQKRCRWAWYRASKYALEEVEYAEDQGLHKQIANRLLEPFMFISVVLSTTSFRHFELLRNHEAAEPHLQYLAKLMVSARSESLPEALKPGEWHLPLIYEEDRSKLNLSDLKKVSTARCAAVSYVRHGERKDYEKDFALYERLTTGGHWSPLEHVATPISAWDKYNNGLEANFKGWKQHRKEFETEFIPDEPYTGPTR